MGCAPQICSNVHAAFMSTGSILAERKYAFIYLGVNDSASEDSTYIGATCSEQIDAASVKNRPTS